MISLTNNSSATTQKLQSFLSGAASTTNPTVTVHSYIVPPQAKPDYAEYRRSPQFTVLAGATETDIADAPVSGSVKDIVQISIYNADTASVTVTVCIDQAGTNEIMIVCTLLTKETLHYEDGDGWYATDSGGARKTALGPNGAFTNLTVSGNATLGDAAGDSLTINAGTATAPHIPLFLAAPTTTATNVTGDGTNVSPVQFGTEITDQGSNFASSTYTAPYTGPHDFFGLVVLTGLTVSDTAVSVSLTTSNRSYALIRTNGGAAGTISLAFNGTVIAADMDAGDTAIIECVVSGSTKTVSIATSSYFSGKLSIL